MKRPENMTRDECVTRIRSLERKVADLQRDAYWQQDKITSLQRWGEERGTETRNAWDRCEELWIEMNNYRMAAGLDPLEKLRLIATYDHVLHEWVPVESVQAQ